MLNRPKSLVNETEEWLRRQIAEGRWKASVPGVPTLAKQCGISEGTVRRALRTLEKEGVLSYAGSGRRRQVTKPQAAPRQSQSLRVAILLRDRMETEDAGFRWVMATAQSEIEAKGHQIVTLAKTQADLHYNDKRIMKLVEQTPADLWIVVAASRGLLEWLSARPAPVFRIGGVGIPGKAIAGAGSGTFPAHQAVIRRLCDLGHRRIVFLLPHFVRHAFPGSKSSTITLLENEFALRGVSASSFHFPDWDETPEGLQAKLESLFRVTPPTAVFATSPVWIAGVLSFLARKGLRVPEDVSVICGHDAGSFHWNRPRIAHYEHGDKRFARRIVQWVDNISRCRKDTKFNPMPVRLVERESIGPVQRG